jgi:hypothetical protein
MVACTHTLVHFTSLREVLFPTLVSTREPVPTHGILIQIRKRKRSEVACSVFVTYELLS